MKYFVQVMAGLGAAAFIVGVLMKFMAVEEFLHGPPVAWWRAAMVFITLGILYALIEIRDHLRST